MQQDGNATQAFNENEDKTMKLSVLEQRSMSKMKSKNPSRPVVSTVDAKHRSSKKREVVQGIGIKESRIIMDERSEEIQRLENEVRRLKGSLSSAESTMKKLMKRDKEMSCR